MSDRQHSGSITLLVTKEGVPATIELPGYSRPCVLLFKNDQSALDFAVDKNFPGRPIEGGSPDGYEILKKAAAHNNIFGFARDGVVSPISKMLIGNTIWQSREGK